MRIEDDIKLDFDDVLIKPKRSVAASRSSVSLKRSFRFLHSSKTLEVIPLLPANMDSTGSINMALAFAEQGAFGCLHKFYQPHEYPILTMDYTFYSMGIQESEFEKLAEFQMLMRRYPPFICIDVANGYTKYFVDFVRKVREFLPFSTIMAGNVATPEMTQELIINGKADIVKVGIGPGSVCTTRLKTGVGYPQLSAIAECADVAHGLNAHVCADGGCKIPGDVAKAFGAGADFVMLGGMLAGAEECEGNWSYHNETGEKYFYCEEDSVITVDGSPYHTRWPEGFKPYSAIRTPYRSVVTHNKELDGKIILEPQKKGLFFHGMSSREAMEQHNGGLADYKTAEGIEIMVPYKGKVVNILQDILGGIRSACAYTGANTLKDLPKTCSFIRVNRIKENLFSVDYHGGRCHDNSNSNCSSS